MKRSEFIEKLGMGTAALPFVNFGNQGSRDKKHPHVLFIAMDDLNDWIGCMGGKTGISTPNIDRLASQGTLFTRAYCSAPSCTPSRTSIMTGRRPSSSGIYNNINYHWRENPLLKDNITLSQHFRNNGYKTMGSGKLFHALSWTDERYGTNQNDSLSWDTYYPSVEQPLPEFVWPEGVELTDSQVKWPPVAGGDDPDRVPPYFFDWGPLDVPDSQTSDYKVSQWAARQIKGGNANQPFFLGVGIFHPHIPWFVPRQYYDMYPLEEIEVPFAPESDMDDLPPPALQMASDSQHWHNWLVEKGLWKRAVQAYTASISYADAQVGRLLEGLKASSFADNTIIALWSDHGFHLGEKQNWEKFTLWEESGRVPLIIKTPGVTTPGSQCGEPVSLLDLYPTLVDLCGLPKQNQTEGQTLVPLLENANQEMGRSVVTTFGYKNHSIRSRRWRYIRYESGEEELYDHDHDQGEFYNLADNTNYDSVKNQLATNLPTTNIPKYHPHK